MHSRFESSDIKPIPKFNVIASILVIIAYSPHAHKMVTRPSCFAKTQRSPTVNLRSGHGELKVGLRPASAKFGVGSPKREGTCPFEGRRVWPVRVEGVASECRVVRINGCGK